MLLNSASIHCPVVTAECSILLSHVVVGSYKAAMLHLRNRSILLECNAVLLQDLEFFHIL